MEFIGENGSYSNENQRKKKEFEVRGGIKIIYEKGQDDVISCREGIFQLMQKVVMYLNKLHCNKVVPCVLFGRRSLWRVCRHRCAPFIFFIESFFPQSTQVEPCILSQRLYHERKGIQLTHSRPLAHMTGRSELALILSTFFQHDLNSIPYPSVKL